MPMVVGLSFMLALRIFVIVTACMFQFVGPVFLYFFQNFLNFCFRVRFKG